VTVFGLTPTGFVTKRLADIRQSLIDLAHQPPPDGFGAGIDTGDDNPLGKAIGLFSVELADVWAAMGQVYASMDPDDAQDDALANLCAITGVSKFGETKTKVTLTIDGTNGTVVPLGSIVRIPLGARFITIAAATIGAAPVDVDSEAEITGPVAADAGTVTEIVTPVVGWDTVTNAADGALGRLVEVDTALRLRREASLQIVGTGPTGAIRSRILANEDVLACLVLENDTDAVDADGLTAHSFLAVVWSGSPAAAAIADVIEAIYLSKPAGIKAVGAISGTVTDDQGVEHAIAYSEATALDVWVEALITVDTDYPIDGDDQCTAAIVAHISSLTIGEDLNLFRLLVDIGGIDGVTGGTIRAKVGSAPGALDVANITVSNLEIATVDPVNVVITQV